MLYVLIRPGVLEDVVIIQADCLLNIGVKDFIPAVFTDQRLWARSMVVLSDKILVLYASRLFHDLRKSREESAK